MGQQEARAEPGVDRLGDLRLSQEGHDPEGGDAEEPHEADRAEQPGHAGRAPGLAHEQPHQDDEAGDQHHRQGHVRADLGNAAQTFHRRQHRDGGGDQGVAVEQGRAADPEEEDPAGAPADRLLGQGHQREDAAFAPVVGSHDDDDVFDRHHQDQGP